MSIRRKSLQQRCFDWAVVAFGQTHATDPAMRSVRFLEEALELGQACGTTREQAFEVLNYVYGRPVGKVPQEVGGTVVCLTVLCQAYGIDMVETAENELYRCTCKTEEIRQRHNAKPAFDLPITKLPTLHYGYDPWADIMTVEGVRYSGGLFRDLGLGPMDTWMKITQRTDGVVTIFSAPKGARIAWEEQR